MKIPTSLYYLPRRTHIFSTALVVYLLLKATELLNKLFRRSEQQCDNAWAKANTRAATLILRTASARRGLWIKCCQYVAARTDALPPEYGAVLSRSLDDCPPTLPRRVAQLVDHALASSAAGRAFEDTHGRAPVVADFFATFDPADPIASASIAQVHVATENATGRRVVLKVQHPGIRPMILQDLQDLKTLMVWIAGAEPKFDMRPVLDAWIDMVPLETDFENERENLTAVRDALAKSPDHLATTAYVPEPLPQYSTKKLFVMEYVDGHRLKEFSATDADETVVDTNQALASVDRVQLIEEVSRSFGNQLFVCEVFSGDPHPGNFLVNRVDEGGHPVLLDFGICVKVQRHIRLGFAKLVIAALANDAYALVQALGEVGVRFNRADPVASLDIIKYLFRTTAPRDESVKQQTKFRQEMEAREKEIEKNEQDTPVMDRVSAKNDADKSETKRESRSPIDSFPGDLVFFFRSLGMLRGLAVSLGVRHSYLEALRPFAQYALHNSCPESERMQSVVYRPFTAQGRGASRAARILEVVFEKLHAADMMAGIQVAVYHRDELVLNMAAGQMGRYNSRPVKPDSLFNSFSTTKGLTAILFAYIQDKYGVEYHDPVSKYWPEYAQCGKGSTTVGHILSHSAGLSQSLPEDMAMPRLRDDWEGIIKHFETAVPSHRPGEKTEYHALTFGWLVAGLMMKISGKSYQEHLKEFAEVLDIADECYCGTMPTELTADEPGSRVACLTSAIFDDLDKGPIGMAMKRAKAKGGVSSGLDGGDQKDISDSVGDLDGKASKVFKDLNIASSDTKAPAYILDPNFFNHPIIRAGFVPSANGHFTARALAKLYALVANEGMVQKTQVIPKARVKQMQEKIVEFTYRGQRAWAAGLTLYGVIDKNGRKIKEGAIGHGGIGGSMAFAVPSEKFSMAVTLNKLNAISVSSAMVIAIVCKSFGVPMPDWYHMFAEKAMSSFKGDGVGHVNDENGMIEQILSGGDSSPSDMMRVLVG